MPPSAIQVAKTMKIMRLSFIGTACMFVYVAFKVPAKVTVPPASSVVLAISVIALASVALGFLAPRFLVRPARHGTNNAPNAAAAQWFSRGILSLAFFNACSLFGFALHFLAADPRIVLALFGMGILSILIWRPGTPPDEDVSLIQS